jgi:glycosyltransferase involved in cell wall biosynthesis
LRQRIKQQIAELTLERNVRLLGNVSSENLVGLYHCSDVFLFPSAYEGFGIVVLEALASGLPVIAGPTPAAKYVAEGNAGYVVDWRQPQKVAELISKLHSDKDAFQTLSNNALTLSKSFDWSNIASRYIQIYDSITPS